MVAPVRANSNRDSYAKFPADSVTIAVTVYVKAMNNATTVITLTATDAPPTAVLSPLDFTALRTEAVARYAETVKLKVRNSATTVIVTP
jgi:hypothetical protein